MEPQNRIHVLNRDRVIDRGLNGNLRALLDLRLGVILSHQLRTGEKLAHTLAFRRRDDEVQGEVRRYPGERKAAGRCDCRKVSVQRNLAAGGGACLLRAYHDWRSRSMEEGTRLGCNGITAKEIGGGRGRGYAGEAKLSTNIAGKRP